jgi:hypothetical protein
MNLLAVDLVAIETFKGALSGFEPANRTFIIGARQFAHG